ncbi:uncharacterized protein MAM_03548 [Metarhizium album ARSEF 1941]|uniref:Uncharacterized protein n=1 Tax=Metarhizium album (strain ARSEF 1941) TaxID=1081103 RepID=A0A0B2WXW0_METAS|nr:uncharacterized protein MAM_03548 [Metarhizium album ARSEF 1941]KHN98424.1 hypothetical protein MAM_03548 [Metarhizium album ARSEF 1941]
MESVDRRLCWNNKPRHECIQTAMKSAFAHLTGGPTGSPAPKYIKHDVKSRSDELAGVRPGRNIEDVEREAIDHLFTGGKKNRSQPSGHWSSRLSGYLHGRRQTSIGVTPESVWHATTSTGEHPETTTAASKSHTRSASQASELKGYSPDEFDDPNPPRKPFSKKYSDLDKYTAVTWNEPDGLQKPNSEEKSKQYKDLDKYASPDTSKETAPAAASEQKYDDLKKYKPVEWNEPAGLPKQSPEELSKNYNDLHKYGPVTWNEPDGLRDLTTEELSKRYDDLNQYRPVTWNEPDGLRKPTPEEQSKKYDDLDSYKTGFVAPDAALKAHQVKQQDPTSKAEPVPAKVAVPAEDPAKEYSDLHKYGPVKWNEPDGLRKPTPEELSKNYKDLHKYSQYPNAGPATPRMHPEQASKQYSDLAKYDSFPNDGVTTERVHPELVSKQYEDLPTYVSAGHEQSDKIKHAHPEELTKNYADLDKYKPQSFDSPSISYPTHPEEASKAYSDLKSYKPIEHNEPNGQPSEKLDPTASSLSAYDSSGESYFEPRTADEIRGDVLRRAYRNRKHTMLQRAKFQQEKSRDSSGKDTEETTGRPGRKADGAKMTGNYAKDFPDEFATSWNTSNSWSKTTLFPKNLAAKTQTSKAAGASVYGSEKEEAEVSSLDESFPIESAKLQPALDRNTIKRATPTATSPLEKMKAEEDPYSRAPQGLETSWDEECGSKATGPTFVRHHKGKANKTQFAATETGTERPPVMYKSLAFDPVSQTMSIAETSSGVIETASPATPAEILLRVSNASKFFPYFSALRAEGYEMASGGGDVLVFRKVRPGPSFAENQGATVNPIDMMGRSAASSFASPTGFVNYESPQYRPATAGQGPELKIAKKRSLGRKVVIGTAWVAGTAYAVSVMGEYFSTGGKVF